MRDGQERGREGEKDWGGGGRGREEMERGEEVRGTDRDCVISYDPQIGDGVVL